MIQCHKQPTAKAFAVVGIMVLLASAACTLAQSGVPGPDEYAAFSHFITDRNIFDPARVPHDYTRNHIFHSTRVRTPRGTPGIQFVGTMSYEKGLFAFFSGNNMDLSKVLQVGDKLQGYLITDITATNVLMTSADKKEQLELEIGDGLRQDNDKWVFSKAGELPVESGPVTVPSSSGSSSSSGTGPTPAAPPPELEQNDVLKRLMEKRAKENQ